jgi:hypothetical protein
MMVGISCPSRAFLEILEYSLEKLVLGDATSPLGIGWLFGFTRIGRFFIKRVSYFFEETIY